MWLLNAHQNMSNKSMVDKMLQNSILNIKIKLAFLWTSLMAISIYGDYFELYIPGKVEKLIEGTSILDSPTKLFLASLWVAIPSLMIALSVFLIPKINRALNIIVGLLLTVGSILVISQSFYSWYSFYVFYNVLYVLINLSIVWCAWKWPTAKNVSSE